LVRLGGSAAGLPTEQIIAASHRLGLTPHFAEAVFDLAFSEGKVLQARFPGAYIAVNISREFLGSGLAIDTVLRCARRAGMALPDVLVELTEDLADGVSTDMLLTELGLGVERGLRMAIDDFGRGETSLSLLRTLPVSAIKLDRSLLPLDDDAKAWAFVAGTVSLLRTMTQRLIAEGIETELQCRRLRELGIDLQQGYLFGQPQPLRHWLEHEVVLPAP
jgi:EAL domain-containing protein (putative c-di-GMP-specific phosphodiesterase class I)